MLGMSSELFNKVVATIAALAFIVALGVFMIYTGITEANEEERMQAIIEKSEALEFQKSLYTSELNRLERDMIARLPNGSTFTPVSLSLDEKLYDSLFPLLNGTDTEYCDEKDAPIKGMICFSPTELPDLEGNISRTELDEIIAAGWTTAIYVNEEATRDISLYLSNMSELLTNEGIDMPDTIYFTKKTYSSQYDTTIMHHGITNIFHHEEEGHPTVSTDLVSPLWRVGCVDWNTMGVAPAILSSLTSGNGNAAFAFDFKEDDPNSCFTADPMASAAVDRMCDMIRSYMLTGELDTGSLAYGRAVYSAYMTAYNEEMPKLNARKAELIKLIDDITAELVAIYEGGYALPPADEESADA